MDDKTKEFIKSLDVWVRSWGVLLAAMKEGSGAHDRVVVNDENGYLEFTFQLGLTVKAIWDVIPAADKAAFVAAILAALRTGLGIK